MTNKINDGGPAFPARPTEQLSRGISITAHHGMTLRDYFAEEALAGLLARGIHYQTEGLRTGRPGLEECDIAGHAYAMADAMLLARGV